MTFRTNIYHNGYKIPVCIKFNSQAKQVILRVDPKNEVARITLPPLTSKSEGLSFARERVGWLVEQLTRYEIPNLDGAPAPLKVICLFAGA